MDKTKLLVAGLLIALISGVGCSKSKSSKGVSVSDTARCEAPVFNLSEGTYNTDQTISITCATGNSTIYYTTDGSAPDTSSAVYSSVISVSGDSTTIQIRAIATAVGYENSSTVSATYTISYNTCAAPTFSVAGGTYNADQSVALLSNTDGATIYYTTDGTAPTTSSPKYSSSISVTGDDTITNIQAIAVKSGMKKSSVSSATYTITYDYCSAPVFDLASGSYDADQTTQITTATSGATIYYTTDGSVPTTSSSKYDSSTTIKISGDGTVANLKAIAVKSGMKASTVTAVTYTISYNTCATPAFSVTGGTYNTDQTITITCNTSGATIYYTTDGTTPTTSSTKYTSAISISGNGTSKRITAIASATGYKTSSSATALYTINYSACSVPTFSPSAGTYNSDQTVTITSTTSGATIYYTIDGTTPTTSSTAYSGPITVSGDDKIICVQAIAVKSDMTASSVSSATYTISYDTCVTPVLSLAAGTYNADQTVTITSGTDGATIYYTTDGSTPTSSSTKYSSGTSISISGDGTSMTITAIAIKSGMKNSTTASAAYVITYSTCATPTFSVASGTYNADQTVELSCTTGSATIYYTTDGSTPTTSSTKYTSAISISGSGTSKTITAIAVASGYKTSSSAAATYKITYDVCSAPVFSPSAGTYNSDQTVTITSETSGATIYYTTSTTTASGSTISGTTEYTGPILISVDGTITCVQAYAVKSGMTTSPVSSATYTISYDYCVTPTFSLSAGTYNADQTVTITNGTDGATIYYTTDGSTPTVSSTAYTSGTSIPISGDGTTVTLKAVAVKSGMKNSNPASAAYVITYDTCATPVFSVDSGTYNAAFTVTLTCTTGAATIYYTTDGSTPTTSSTKYSSAMSISGDGTSEVIKAIAVASGYKTSAIASAAYVISYSVCSVPEFSPEGGTYSSDQTITITTNTSGATIYYTTDGTTPSTSSTAYTGSLTVSGNGTSKTIKAIAAKTGMTNSSTISETYVINTGACSAPVLSPAGGSYSTAQTVTMTCTTSGATIYYTTDGTTPTTSSNVYSGGITLSTNGITKIKAYAVHSEMTASSVVGGVFSILATPITVNGTVELLVSGLSGPQGVVSDGTNLYISDSWNYKVFEYNISGATTSVLAGTGSAVTSQTDGTGTAAGFNFPWGVATDGVNLYVSDAKKNVIRQIVIDTGVVTTIAGTWGSSGTTDGVGTAALFNTPCGLATDGENLYIADQGNSTIRKMVLSTKSVSTFAGTAGSSGSANGIGTAASFYSPSNLTMDGTYMYVSDASNHMIRRIVLSTASVTTLAGSTSNTTYKDGTGTAAGFVKPFGIFADGVNVYVTDYSDFSVRKIVASTGVVTTVISPGSTFNMPTSLTSDGTTLFVSDKGNGKIKKLY